MTTEELIETFIDAGVSAFKKNYRHGPQGRSLDRKQPTEICGMTFTTWRELAVYGMAEHIKELLPGVDVECWLDGNDSRIEVSLTEEEQRELNGKMFVFLKKWGCL